MARTTVTEEIEFLYIESRMDQPGFGGLPQYLFGLLFCQLSRDSPLDEEFSTVSEEHTDFHWHTAIVFFVQEFCFMAAKAGVDGDGIGLFNIGIHLVKGVHLRFRLERFVNWNDSALWKTVPLRRGSHPIKCRFVSMDKTGDPAVLFREFPSGELELENSRNKRDGNIEAFSVPVEGHA